MNKCLNKGLLYAWFNSAKAAITIGILVWGFIANRIITHNLMMVSNEISDSFSNYFSTTQLYDYFMLGVIFIAIYYIAKGSNKRNTEMFLTSGPYTKKQIRYNELICLLITLVFFVITYVYIAIMAYVSQREFISIVEGYQGIIAIEIVKIVLLGAMGIIFMLIIDSMFSNSVIGFICMLTVIPLSILMIFMRIYSMLEYFGFGHNYGLNEYDSNSEIRGYTGNILFDKVSIKYITIKGLLTEIIVTLIIILILMVIYNVVQRRFKLENYNKTFASKTNENIMVILVSTAIGSFTSLLLVEGFIHGMQRKNGGSIILYGTDLLKGLGADIICIVISGFISYKIIKKVLKNIV